MGSFRKPFFLLGFLYLLLAANIAAYANEGQAEESLTEVKVTYESQVQDIGWQEPVSNGTLSGTTGKALRMEAIKMKIENSTIGGGITYRSYVEGIGWTDWGSDGAVSGTTGESRVMKALEVKLTGAMAEAYDIYYHVFVQNYGWLDYAVNGQTAGTIDISLRIEAIEVTLTVKGSEAPGATAWPFRATYEERIDPLDQKTYLYHFDGYKMNGWLLRNGNKYYAVSGAVVTGWHYLNGYKYYFDETGALVQNVESIIGKQDSYVIKINKEANCVTIYAKDGNNGYTIPVKAMLCSTGDTTPIGTFKTPEKYRWRLMIHDVYTQYATRIIAGQGFLMHSVVYNSPNSYDLWSGSYNGLGTLKSAGCVRLTTADAKWIYDNCKLGTTVTIYNDPVPGPFDRPVIKPIPGDQTWDPTDPNL